MVDVVEEYLIEQKADDTFICFGDELLVDSSASVERCVVCYRCPLSPRYVSVHCRKHIVCVECGDRLKTCPLCRRRVQALYRHLEARRINNNVKLRCPFHVLGCMVECDVETWKTHIRECPFEGEAWLSHLRQRWAKGEKGTFSFFLGFLQKGYRRLKLRTFGTLGPSEGIRQNDDFTTNSTEL